MKAKAVALLILSLSASLVPVLPASAEPAAWRAEGWTRTDFGRTTIKWGEILSGGPPKDGIPSIDKPLFKPVTEVSGLAPVDPVIGLEIAGDARAYPLRILIWHEIVNDVVGGRPVAVTYCPLCNSALVFERRVGERVLDFGTTGKLRNSDLVMYDRQTESWWQQFTGEAIVGAFLGTALKLVPARLESFADFKARHPGGRVLVPTDPHARRYGDNPYEGYDRSARPFLYQGELPSGVPAMARVVVVRPETGAPVIVALEHVRKNGPLTIGALRLSWRAGRASAVDAAQIAKGRDVGTVEVVRIGEDGTRTPVVYDVTFAFVAHAFHPEVPIVKAR
ncbi:MAG: DUF3179 domain-containing protein [Hyphomicrobiaceae bacterium]|nr:DUF3179 domain-containing protein [Hyphomicrobiaceae bacterium]